MEQFDAAQLLQKLNSAQGKQLLELLKKDGGAAFSKAAVAARSGNYELAKTILSPILKGTQAEELARSLTDDHG